MKNDNDEIILQPGEQITVDGGDAGKMTIKTTSLTWTTDKPTKPGWYWYFDRTETYHPLRPIIFEVQHLPNGKFAIMTHLNLWGETEDYRYVEDLDGQFAGPLELPQ